MNLIRARARIIIACAVACLTSMPAIWAGSNVTDEQASQLRLKGNYQEAAGCYLRLVQSNPASTLYWSKLAECYALLGQSDKAINACNKVLSLDPKYVWAYDLRANAYMQKNNPKAALADANREVELDPKSAMALMLRATIHLNLKDSLALADSDKAIQLSPNDAKAYWIRAQCFWNAGDDDKTLRDCNTALRLNPKLWSAIELIVHAYSRKHQPEKALAEVQRAESYKIFEPLSFAALCADVGLYPEAIRQYDQTLRNRKFEELAHAGKANCCIFMGQFDLANREASEAIKFNPKDVSVYWFRAQSEIARGNLKSAIADLNTALIKDPKANYLFAQRGKLLEQTGQHQAAVEDFNKAIKLGFTSVENYTKRGESYFRMGNSGAALKDAEHALSINRNFVPAIHVRVWVYLQQKKFNLARSEAQRAVQLEPKDASTWSLMAHVCKVTDDEKGRLDALKKVIECDPENAEAKIALSDAHSASSLNLIKGIDSKYEHFKKGLSPLEEDVKNNPGSAAAYMARAEYYKRAFEPATAVKDYTLALKFAPNLQSAYVGRGECYMQLENWQLAQNDFAKACKISPADIYAVRQLGRVDQVMGQDDKAIEDYSRYLSLRKNQIIFADRAMILCRHGKVKEALSDAASAIATSRGDSLGYSVRADIEMKTGDFNKAVTDYTQAISLKRDHAELLNKRAAAYDKLGNTKLRDRDLASANSTAKEIFDAAPFRITSPSK